MKHRAPNGLRMMDAIRALLIAISIVGIATAAHAQGAAADATDWAFGERYFGASFGAPLEINNRCKTKQVVGILVNGISYLTLPRFVEAPPGKMIVMGQVQLPDEPDPLHEGEGHVDFGVIYIPPGMFPPPKLHQPDFLEMSGTVDVWHPAAPPECNAARQTYTIGGHIHYNPPRPDDGPSSLATTDVCTLYWNLGVAPDQLDGRDCTSEMRVLAIAFVERILAPYVQNAPEQWGWLPSAGAIGSMSIPQMLGMKARAEGVMGHGDGNPPPTPSATASASSTTSTSSTSSTSGRGISASPAPMGSTRGNASFGIGTTAPLNRQSERSLESAAPIDSERDNTSRRIDGAGSTPPPNAGDQRIRREPATPRQTGGPAIARPEDNTPPPTTGRITGTEPEESAPPTEDTTP